MSPPDFLPEETTNDVILPANTVDVPGVMAQTADAGASLQIFDADGLPGTTEILVTAEDNQTTQMYTLNFIIESISGLSFPESVVQGETLSASVSYAAASILDLVVVLEQNTSPYTSYGEARVTVPSGSGTKDIEIIVDPGIPVANDAYTLSAGLLPEGGSWADRLDEYAQENIDALAAPSDDATLSGILVNDTLIRLRELH
ncbi:MAG: hypothetical protein KAS71_02040, partial [Bacteroidales bacterium]|nr:hypothetical protein [Bacteroidales bacterium]